MSVSQQRTSCTVLITSYNQKEYLRAAVDSVLAQTRPPDQIIIADDGSSDGSADLIGAYERTHSGYVRGLLQEKNIGIPRNRNAGLSLVTTDFVAVLDGDDWYLPHNLARQLDALQHNPGAVCCYSNIYLMDEQGTHFRIRDQMRSPSGMIFPRIINYIGLLRSMVMKTAAVKSAGCFDPRFPMHDGYLLTVKLAQLGPFEYIFEPLMAKREHAASDSGRHSYRTRVGYHRALREEIGSMLSGQPAATARWVMEMNGWLLFRLELMMYRQENNRAALYRTLLVRLLRQPRAAPRAWRVFQEAMSGLPLSQT